MSKNIQYCFWLSEKSLSTACKLKLKSAGNENCFQSHLNNYALSQRALFFLHLCALTLCSLYLYLSLRHPRFIGSSNSGKGHKSLHP